MNETIECNNARFTDSEAEEAYQLAAVKLLSLTQIVRQRVERKQLDAGWQWLTTTW